MIQIIRDVEQGSDEWFTLRAGSIGASSISKIITSTGKRSSQRKAFLYQIAGERITGRKSESYSNGFMQAGIDAEESGRKFFELKNNVKIEEVGMILPFEDAKYHCSPDGIIVGVEEGFEQKNVIPGTQAKYLDKGVLPTEYRLQVQFSLAVTDWLKWWFFSRCEGMPPLIIDVSRDEDLIKIIKAEINIFLREVNELIERIS